MKPWRSIGALPYLFIATRCLWSGLGLPNAKPTANRKRFASVSKPEFSTQILLYGGDADERVWGQHLRSQ